jgi:HlyD family secretion protein
MSRALVLPLVALLVAGGCANKEQEIATFRVEPVTFQRRVVAEGTLEPVKATQLDVPQSATAPMKIAWIAEDGTRLRKGDVVARFDEEEFRNLLLSGTEERGAAANKLTKAGAEAAATRKNLGRDARLAESELEAARRFKFDDAEIFSRFARIEADVDADLATQRKRHAEEVRGVRENLARVERELLAIEDRKAGIKIRQAEEGLEALQIVAPHDGILVLERSWRGDLPRPGDTVWRGQTVGEIPELSSMQAQVFVLEADAAGLAAGQKATLVLEADARTPFTGTVKSVDKVARPRIPRQPVQYFGATVELHRTDSTLMKPGARVRAVLDVERQTGAVAIPRQALFEKDGKKLVYRKNGNGFAPVEVTLGSSSAGRVVVTKGLKAGDEIALADPTGDGGREALDEQS